MRAKLLTDRELASVIAEDTCIAEIDPAIMGLTSDTVPTRTPSWRTESESLTARRSRRVLDSETASSPYISSDPVKCAESA